MSIVDLSLLSRKEKNAVLQVLISYKRIGEENIDTILTDIVEQMTAQHEKPAGIKYQRKDILHCPNCGREKMKLRCGSMICPVC